LFDFFILHLDLTSGSNSTSNPPENLLVQTIEETRGLLLRFETRRDDKQPSLEDWGLKIALQRVYCKGMLLTLELLTEGLSKDTFASKLSDVNKEMLAIIVRLSILRAERH
jgi:hypothetical protein